MIDTRFIYQTNDKKYKELMLCFLDGKKYIYVAELDSRDKPTGKTHIMHHTENDEYIYITNEEEKIVILQQMYQEAKDFYKLPAVKWLMLREILFWLSVPIATLFFYVSPVISIIIIIIAPFIGGGSFALHPIAEYLEFKKVEKMISKYEKKHW